MQIKRILSGAAVMVALVLALGLATRSARAETVYMVNTPTDHNDGSCDANDCSLREAVYAAQLVTGGGTVRFDPSLAQYSTIDVNPANGWISLSANTTVFVDGEMTLNGSVLGNITITDNGGKLFYLYQGTRLDLENLTISGTHSANGGAIQTFQSTVNLNHTTFSGNSADTVGGVIINHLGTLNVTDSTFVNNSAPYYGGAIHNASGTVNVANSTFVSNSSGSGGAIYNYNGTLNVTNSTFSGNSAGFGGALFNEGGPYKTAAMNVFNSTFDANLATGDGSPSYPSAAAILNNYGTLTVANSLVLRGNLNAGGSGKLGGIGTNSGPALILNSTIANNTNGGVWTGYFGYMTLKNTILAGNEGANCYGPTGDGGYNLTSDSSCFFSDLKHSLSNVDALLDPNDGLTLQPGSPAIDAGDDSVCAADPVNNLDFAGDARPKGPHCDMGAFEMERGTLIVVNHVINDEGGTKSASDLTVNVTAANSVSFPGAEAPGTTVGIAPGSYDVTVSGDDGYVSTRSNCTGTIANNQTATCTITSDDIAPPPPVLDFDGFFSPVDNTPTVNVVKAGGSVPVKFSLNGDQGLDILADGYPASHEMDCNSEADRDPIEETATAGNNSLSYDPATDTYTYVWKTAKAWAGTCRKLVVRLSDGSDHKANFKFK